MKYTGREDDGTGLYYYRARYYDPQIGRFLSEDKLGFGAGINFYAYVANNPVNANDPTGNVSASLPLWTGAIGAVAGGAGSAIGQSVNIINSGGDFRKFNWTNVGVATGVGFVAGAAAPVVAEAGSSTLVKVGSIAAIGAVSNMAQYGIGQMLSGQPMTSKDAVINGVTGAIGGLIGGPVSRATNLRFSENSPWLDAAAARALNEINDIGMNVGGSGLARNILGSTTSSIDVSGFSLSGSGTSTSTSLSPYTNLATSGAFLGGSSAANGGFLLYPNKLNTNMSISVYHK